MSLVEKTLQTQNGTLCYWVSRAGEAEGAQCDAPWLVFLPGLTADHGLFGPQLECFDGSFNLLTWDPPLHGKSRPWTGSFDLVEQAHLLKSVLESEGAASPVLVGQSMGGYLSQVFIQEFPGVVRGFVSIDSCPLKRGYYAGWELYWLRRTYWMYRSIPWKLLIGWGSNGVATSPQGRAYMRGVMESFGKLEYCELADAGYRALAEAVKATGPERTYDITCPLLVLCGEKDAAGSAKRFNRVWHQREGVDLVWVPGAGHNSNRDAPDFVNERIREFVQGLFG